MIRFAPSGAGIIFTLAIFCLSGCSDDGTDTNPASSVKPLDAVGTVNDVVDEDHWWFNGVPIGEENNREFRFSFSVPIACSITLSVFSYPDNRPIWTRELYGEQGMYEVIWRCCDKAGNPVPPGLYRYSLQAGGYYAEKWLTVRYP